MNKSYYVSMGRTEKEYFSLPEKWVPVHFSEVGEVSVASVEKMTLDALLMPVSTAPLENLISGARNIAIIIDDCTRPTPVPPILGSLLPYLAENGFPRENITIVVALGTHAPISQDDLVARVGREVALTYRIVQHDAWQDDLVSVKLPDGGGTVKINPEVARADFKIGISSILPHPMAGYGGGPKIIMPGVADFDYIKTHHMKLTIDPQSFAGHTEGNPFHEACMKVARTVGLDFSINCVYNQQGEVVRIIGGGLDTAFKAAVDSCFEQLGVVFEEKVDVTITSTYPHTHAHQFVKGLSAPDVVTKETGAILVAVPTVTPLPPEFVNSFNVIREKSGNNPVAYVREAMSQGMRFLPDKPLEFNMAMKCAFIRPKIRTILVSPLISEQEAKTMGFDYAPSVASGVSMLENAYPEARAAIFPSGGLIVPITSWER